MDTENSSIKKKIIVGVGSALIDLLVKETDAFLDRLDALKGGMSLVNKEYINKLISDAAKKPLVVPGGSACNTVIGVGNLGGDARFIGKCGQGKYGNLFESDLKKNGVDPVLFKSKTATGRVVSVITPDAQRSMFTYLGASSEMTSDELILKCFEDSFVVHIEGYLLFNPELIKSVLGLAKKSGALVSLDLASFNIVNDSRDLLCQIVEEYVDILIANEDEAYAYTGFKDEIKTVESLAKHVDIAILKVGKEGSYINNNGNIEKIEPVGDGYAIDTTGAGDMWAAGFLYGLVKGYSMKKCGNIGSACGYEVCQVIGANISEAGWTRIKSSI